MSARQQKLWPDPQPIVERLGPGFFRRLPERPGVYLMHGEDDAVLYVGKAKSLRHRLNSYRVANPDRMPRRTLRLLRRVVHIAWEECADEPAALRREAELLRALRPRFNRAGVFPGKPRFLRWRASQGRAGVEWRLTEEPAENAADAGWESAGPFGGRAISLHRALVLLLWTRLQPERGLAGMPPGWLRGKHGPEVILPCADPAAAPVAVGLLRDYFRGDPEPLHRWLVPPATPLTRELWEEALETLAARPAVLAGPAHREDTGP